jgi:hypothetical protein
MRFTRLECQDPRDIVYGLLSLLPPESQIAVDYARPANVLFWDLIHAMGTAYLSPLRFLELGRAMEVTGKEENCIKFISYCRLKYAQTPEEIFSR